MLITKKSTVESTKKVISRVLSLTAHAVYYAFLGFNILAATDFNQLLVAFGIGVLGLFLTRPKLFRDTKNVEEAREVAKDGFITITILLGDMIIVFVKVLQFVALTLSTL